MEPFITIFSGPMKRGKPCSTSMEIWDRLTQREDPKLRKLTKELSEILFCGGFLFVIVIVTVIYIFFIFIFVARMYYVPYQQLFPFFPLFVYYIGKIDRFRNLNISHQW